MAFDVERNEIKELKEEMDQIYMQTKCTTARVQNMMLYLIAKSINETNETLRELSETLKSIDNSL